MTNREKLIKFYNDNLEHNQSTIIELFNGEHYLMVGSNLFLTNDGYMYYENEDLSAKYTKSFGVESAYSCMGACGCNIDPKNFDHKIIINDSIEFTIDEIADEFEISPESIKIKE